MRPTVALPGTDLHVFPLNLGGNTFGWTADEATSLAILRAFTEAGGNFIDTADVYSAWVPGHQGGESEAILGSWLADLPAHERDQMVIATKVGRLRPHDSLRAADILAATTNSLERLRTETIDLLYLHFDDDTTPIEEQIEACCDLVARGHVRYIGLSNYSPQRMRAFLRAARDTEASPVAIQPHYNLLHRHDYERGIRPLAQEYRASVFPYYSLASGVLTGKFRTPSDTTGTAREASTSALLTEETQGVLNTLERLASLHDATPATIALAWLRAKGATAPIASVSRPEQLPALMAVADTVLDPSEVMQLDAASQPFA
ncbi:aldo/keto reductase [Corynebacterium lowii]|uniref:General stress protein 69 n=1 Tax=Corynebacterium lowii TaxID=1544413 RepID=A0A0Q0YEN0_9CORY|nr:aldo/keto reductase [Corynebacterium lowii]KQB84844.1 General stress protein 69 [Corynebacterium lowii]MDP9851748.1 aryl-alcohol dehydrogenase-like predicted oxidoreductase [Corynebacterium lowii]